jgi:uncharacterized damage-inducible protein DinB
MAEHPRREPWLRGTLKGLPPVHRGALHALELAEEDIARWCRGLSDAQLNARPAGVPSIAFHLRHIARSLDRLLTYAEDKQLQNAQRRALESELDAMATAQELFSEFDAALAAATARIRALLSVPLDATRRVGQKELPTTVGGLLLHIAEHTQRHVGQAITTAKVVQAMKGQTQLPC